MRRILSLEALKIEGMDPEFFLAGELIEIPAPLVDLIERWCKEANVANTSLPSKGAVRDDPLDVYYIRLATKPGRVEFKDMLKTIAQPFVEAANVAASSLIGKTIFTRAANGSIDEIIALGTFRNQLMVYAAKPAKAEGDDVTLVIYV